MRGLKLKLGDMSYLDFRRISTNWKNNRKSIEHCDPRRQKEDTRLQQAFARVKWDQ